MTSQQKTNWETFYRTTLMGVVAYIAVMVINTHSDVVQLRTQIEQLTELKNKVDKNIDKDDVEHTQFNMEIADINKRLFYLENK